MFLGKVIGTVWSTVKWPQVQGLKLLVVRPYHLADLAGGAGPARSEAGAVPSPGGGPDCEAVVCVDLLDAGVGDDVVVAFGHAARVAAEVRERESGSDRAGSSSISALSLSLSTVPIDAAVVAVVDSIEVARPGT